MLELRATTNLARTDILKDTDDVFMLHVNGGATADSKTLGNTIVRLPRRRDRVTAATATGRRCDQMVNFVAHQSSHSAAWAALSARLAAMRQKKGQSNVRLSRIHEHLGADKLRRLHHQAPGCSSARGCPASRGRLGLAPRAGTHSPSNMRRGTSAPPEP